MAIGTRLLIGCTTKIPLIDHANVACGFHAGDPLIMSVQQATLLNCGTADIFRQETVRTCKEHGIKVGAHPGLPDLQGFGRRE